MSIFQKHVRGEKSISAWLVEGGTILIPKTRDLSNPKKSRPITCLNTISSISDVLIERILCTINPVWKG